MELLHHLTLGFHTALSMQNLLYCFIGVLLGTLIGVLPGLGPVPAILLFCAIGVYSVQNNTIDVLLTIPLGILGYVFMKLGCEPTPLMRASSWGP